MVQIKVSTVLLAAVIASLSAQQSVLAKNLNGDVAGYQRSEYQDPVIRAIAQEVLYGRSELTSLGYSSLSARGLELDTREELGAIPRFFKDVGGVVKRMFSLYWRDVEDNAALFDLRQYYHRKHVRRATPATNPPSEESGKVASGDLSARHHLETNDEARATHSTKHLRRRFTNGRIDDGYQAENKMRRRMDFDQMVRRYNTDADDLKARNYNHLRRRMDNGDIVTRDTDSLEARNHNHLRRRMDFDQIVARDRGESDDLEARNHNHLRRRMDFDQMVARDNVGSDGLEARSHNHLRRRMDFDQIVQRDSDDLELRDEELGLLPRMSWFGKSLLIYRNVANGASLEERSDESLFDRDLVEGLHEEW